MPSRDEHGIYLGIEVANGKLVRQGLENFAKALPDIGRLRIYTGMRRVYQRLGVYAPQKQTQHYARTGNPISQYFRSGELHNARELIKLDLGYAVLNDPVSPYGVHYATFVRGDMIGEGQSYNADYWELLENIVDEELGSMPDEVLEALQVELDKDQTEANVGT